VQQIKISPEEVARGEMTAEHLELAARAVREDGVVVLEGVVDRDHIAALREKALADLALLQAREDAPYNWNAGNIQQELPPFPPYLFRDVLVNDLAIAVTAAVLGPGVKNAYYSGNTALRSDQRQPVHADLGQLWPNLSEATPAFGLVLNVPLVDVSPENGSTEIWPGTHRDTTLSMAGDIKVPEAALARWRERTPPVQPTLPAGSILIRDIRLWHAGMPNRTDQPRPMIAMIHWVSWFCPADTLRFPKGTEPFFEHPRLKTHAVFVDGPIDYIGSPQAYEYAPRSTLHAPR